MAPAETDPTDADGLPSIDALLAGTFALMTAWADPCPQARVSPADLRGLLARKVVSNLFFLQHHPHLRPELRQALAQAHARWVALVHPTPASQGPAPRTFEPGPFMVNRRSGTTH